MNSIEGHYSTDPYLNLLIKNVGDQMKRDQDDAIEKQKELDADLKSEDQ